MLTNKQEIAERSGNSDKTISAPNSRARAAQRKKPAARKASLNGRDSRSSVSIVVVDDHRFMRDVMCAMLSRQAERYSVVGHASNAADAVKICAETKPDLVVLDVNLPDRSGVDAVRDIKQVSPHSHVLLCTAFVSEDRIVEALRSGAQGFVEKTNSWSEFADAVDRVSKGEHYFAARSIAVAPNLRPNGASAPGAGSAPHLSQRENQVLKLIAHGRTSKEVASELGISVATVDTHRTNLMSKLQIRNVAGLVVHAFRCGLIKLEEANGSTPAA